MELIYEGHWVGGNTKRYLHGDYLITLTETTGSSVMVEQLLHPYIRSKSGIGYQDWKEVVEERIKFIESGSGSCDYYGSGSCDYYKWST